MTQCSISLLPPPQVFPYSLMQITVYQDKSEYRSSYPVSEGTEYFMFLVCYKYTGTKVTSLTITLLNKGMCIIILLKRNL